MTIVKDGADQLISQFGETVTVIEEVEDEPDDSNDPVYFSESSNTPNKSEHQVRLYTTPSKETLQEYGLDDNTDSMMYSTEDIADNGDTVEYSSGNKQWYVNKTSTNQIGKGPYLFVYSLLSK